ATAGGGAPRPFPPPLRNIRACPPITSADGRRLRFPQRRRRIPRERVIGEVEDTVKKTGLFSRIGVSTLAAGLSIGFLSAFLGSAHPTQAALIDGGKGPQLLIGADDDRQDNIAVQAGAAANQSLNRTDVITGGQGNDVIFGLNGNDVIDGGQGSDIILGGPDGGAAPGGPP